MFDSPGPPASGDECLRPGRCYPFGPRSPVGGGLDADLQLTQLEPRLQGLSQERGRDSNPQPSGYEFAGGGSGWVRFAWGCWGWVRFAGVGFVQNGTLNGTLANLAGQRLCHHWGAAVCFASHSAGALLITTRRLVLSTESD